MKKNQLEILDVINASIHSNHINPVKKEAWQHWGQDFILYVKDKLQGRRVDKSKLEKDILTTLLKLSTAGKTPEEIAKLLRENKAVPEDEIINKKRAERMAELLSKNEVIIDSEGILTATRTDKRGIRHQKSRIPPDVIRLGGILYCHLAYFIKNKGTVWNSLQSLWEILIYPDSESKGDVGKNLQRSPYHHDYLEEYWFWVRYYFSDIGFFRKDVGSYISEIEELTREFEFKRRKYTKDSPEIKRIEEEYTKRIKELKSEKDFEDVKKWYEEQKGERKIVMEVTEDATKA